MSDDAPDVSDAFWSRMAAADTPRPMTLTARLSLLFGALFFFGAIFAGFGLIFVAVFRPHDSLRELVVFRGPLENEAAVVTGVEDTNMSENDRRIHRVTADFEHAGHGYEIVSYRIGGGPNIGEQTTAEFPAGDPAGGRLVKHRWAPCSPFVSFILIFPAVGLAMCYFTVRSGLRKIRHYRNGAVAVGTLTSKDATNVEINDQRVYQFGYRFNDAADREVTGTVRTHETAGLPAVGESLLLTYLPWDPSCVQLVNDPRRSSDRLRINEWGVLEGGSLVAAIAGMLVATGLLGAVAYLFVGT